MQRSASDGVYWVLLSIFSLYVADCGDDDSILGAVVHLVGGGKWCVASSPKALARNLQPASAS